MQLGELERCRKIYQRQIEVFPQRSQVWIEYAEFEAQLDEQVRARQLFEIASSSLNLDLPEKLWMAYIDFEISLNEFANVRQIYARLLDKSKHLKVWVSYAKFESENARDASRARNVYQEAYTHFKTKESELKEERLMILEQWIGFEQGPLGNSQDLEMVQQKIPKKVKKRRKVKVVNQETGEELNEDAGWEEYYDYVFPDDMEQKKNLKILEMAHKWKKEGVAK